MAKNMQKVLSLKDLTLFTVSAIILLDTLAASAAIGVSSLFWWLFLGAVFLVPIGMITAELGTSFPSEGGIYVWIRRAFGEKWAARAAWAYWINTAIWLPALFILFSGVSARLFNLDIGLTQQIFIGIGLTWATVMLDVVGLKIGKWVPDIGAVFKLVIFLTLIIAGFRYGLIHGFANEISLSAIQPRWEDGLKYLPVIIYGMLGFELVSSAGDEIKNPKKDVPRAILISGILIIALYTFSTAGILAAIPSGDLDIVEGLVDTLFLLFADIPGGTGIVYILGVCALFTFFSNGATWAMGCNRSASEAAADGQLPRIFAWRFKEAKGPVGAAIMMGCVCTIALVAYGSIASSNQDLFWNLFAFSAVLFMLPYIGMCLAFLRLRQVERDHPRPFRFPGSNAVATFFAMVCVVILVLAIGLFMYVPGEGLQMATIVGFVIVLIIGEILIVTAIRSRRKLAKVDT